MKADAITHGHDRAFIKRMKSLFYFIYMNQVRSVYERKNHQRNRDS